MTYLFHKHTFATAKVQKIFEISKIFLENNRFFLKIRRFFKENNNRFFFKIRRFSEKKQIYMYFSQKRKPNRHLIATWSPPGSNGCSMDAERVLNGCSYLASSIVTTTKSRYLLKKICDRLFSSKSCAKVQLFFHISKFFATK